MSMEVQAIRGLGLLRASCLRQGVSLEDKMPEALGH